MKKCTPNWCKCNKKNDQPINAPNATVVLPSEVQMLCGQCRTMQSVSKDATVFVCISCHTVNRIGSTGNGVETPTVLSGLPEANGKSEMTFRRVNSSTFMAVDGVPNGTATNATNFAATAPPGIGPCSVCMDGAGDMVFLTCLHGGVCEACARHIAQNMAVGGSHCPRCRQSIQSIARIIKVDKDMVKAVSVEVQTFGDHRAPPKVPPPRGFNKAKK